MTPKHSNYDRICAECASYRHDKKAAVDSHMCTRPANLITGDPVPTRCSTARSASGHCGPQGRNFSAAGVVVPARKKLQAAE